MTVSIIIIIRQLRWRPTEITPWEGEVIVVLVEVESSPKPRVLAASIQSSPSNFHRPFVRPGIRRNPQQRPVSYTPLPHLANRAVVVVVGAGVLLRIRGMVEFSLVASAALPPAILHPEHRGLCKAPKVERTVS